MAKLKPDDEIDLVIGPSRPYTDEERAAVSRAIAESRKKPGHAEALEAMRRTIERVEKAQKANRRTKTKPGRSAA